MSMISELVKDLRFLENYEKDTGDANHYAQWFESAADTIEELSTKLSAAQMERSSQYYHGGWILCEERMPEEHESRVAKLFYGTINWSPTMHRKESYNVIVTAEFADGTRRTEIMYTRDGKWFFINTCFSKFKVIAWQPFPEPYWEKQNET